MLRIDGNVLHALRTKLGLTREELGEIVGVNERTLRRMENGGTDSQPANVRAIAKALGVATHVIVLKPEADPVSKTDVERLARAEVVRGVAVVEKPSGARVFNASVLQRLNTAHESVDEEEYALRGRVETHREVTELEAAVLGSVLGRCARFLIAAPASGGRTLRVTVHTATLRETKPLIDAYESASTVELAVRVAIVRMQKGRITASTRGAGSRAPSDGPPWRGFMKLAPKEPQPWILLVESVDVV